MRERWIALRRAEGRRRLRVLTAAVLAVALAAGGYALTRSALLAVTSVEVQGTAHTDPAAVARASGVEHGDALLWVDADSARRRVLRVPWVATARVAKDWPHTLRIRITERVAVAWTAGDDGAVVLVDASGRVLERVDAPPEGTVEVQVPGATVPRPGRTIAATGAAAAAGALGPLAERAAVVTMGDGGIRVTLDGGVEVRMGEATGLAAKAAAADAVLAELARTKTTVTYVDVTVAANPVAR